MSFLYYRPWNKLQDWCYTFEESRCFTKILMKMLKICIILMIRILMEKERSYVDKATSNCKRCRKNHIIDEESVEECDYIKLLLLFISKNNNWLHFHSSFVFECWWNEILIILIFMVKLKLIKAWESFYSDGNPSRTVYSNKKTDKRQQKAIFMLLIHTLIQF